MPSDADVPTFVSRRRALQLLAGAAAVAVSWRAFDEQPEPASRPDVTTVSAERRYRGTATTVLDSGSFATGESTQQDVEVAVTQGVEESATPFELVVDGVGTDRADGLARLVTARRGGESDADADGEAPADRYWDLRAGAAGAFSGTLHTPSVETNALSSRRELIPSDPASTLPVKEAMTEGTTLVGELTPDRIELHVSGNTSNQFAGDLLNHTRPFETTIRATRVEA